MAIAMKARRGSNPQRIARSRRHRRVRKKVSGSLERPRLVVSRSLRHITAQVVDDAAGRTLVAASSHESGIRTATADKTAKAREVGVLVAQRAQTAGIQAVVFDRGGNAYHGRIAALADAARKSGLTF